MSSGGATHYCSACGGRFDSGEIRAGVCSATTDARHVPTCGPDCPPGCRPNWHQPLEGEWVASFPLKECELAEPFVDGVLNPDQAHRFRSHMDECASCQAAVARVLQLRALVRAAGSRGEP